VLPYVPLSRMFAVRSLSSQHKFQDVMRPNTLLLEWVCCLQWRATDLPGLVEHPFADVLERFPGRYIPIVMASEVEPPFVSTAENKGWPHSAPE
jgi:hypothetical protein